jgi:hypothetical protein
MYYDFKINHFRNGYFLITGRSKNITKITEAENTQSLAFIKFPDTHVSRAQRI